ncbi:hypothetical protein ACFSO7_02930 [Bacillus sp. CGMCC 1.16607]|uniref:hypothetical protein n=1 Tax=Bacillus sp. CGMCC 1.16607 TaxID=3351842 RepID=UPI003641AEF2
MNIAELVGILEEIGFPVAYSQFNDPPSPPYICYLVSHSSNFFADDEIYHEIENVQIELYTTKKDLLAERKVKEVLKAHELVFETSEIYIDSEKLFQKIFEVRLI